MPSARARRTAAGVVTLAVAAATLAGCSFGVAEEDSRPVVAFLGGADPDDRHYESDAEALRSALRADCEDCEYAAFDAGGDVEVQAEQLTQVLDGGADVVILQAVDGEAGEELVEQAGDVPVVAMDRFVPGADYHVGYDPERLGRQLVREARGAAQGDGGLGVLLLGGSAGDLIGTEAAATVRRTLGEGDEILAEDVPDVATAEDAETWTTQQLADRPADAVDVVLAVDENQAEGAAAAVEALDRPDEERPVVVGVGSGLDTWRRLILGAQAAAVREEREAVVRRTVETAAEVLEGAPVTDTEDVDGVPSFLGRPQPVTLRTLTTVVVADGSVTTEQLCEGETEADCTTYGIR